MKLTSAMANKLLKDYQRQIDELEQLELERFRFTVATNENIEDARPEYDYETIRRQEDELARKIIKLKHAINKFNVETVVPGFEMTIDKILIWMPILNDEKCRLGTMASIQPKRRIGVSNQLIEYQYANYDVKKVSQDYENIVATLRELQLALDTVNNTVEFEVEL